MTPLNDVRVRYWQHEIEKLPDDTIILEDYLNLAQAWDITFQDFPEDTLEEIAIGARVPLEDARALMVLPAHHRAALVAHRNPRRKARQIPRPTPPSIWDHLEEG